MSADFELFKKIIQSRRDREKKEEEDERNKEVVTFKTVCLTIDKETCVHAHVLLEGSHKICENCGALMNKELSFEKDWRFYGMNDTRHHYDPNRCHGRKVEDITIYKDVEYLGFSEKIVLHANRIYEEVTEKKIYRGKSRRGIIFACIFHAYKLNETPQSCESLLQVFGIERKVALQGLKYVHLNASKESLLRQRCICPEDLIVEIMDKFYATSDQKSDILCMYQRIQNKSSLLNRSRPQSVASGMVRYYILRKGKDIPMHIFRTIVGLSELTIHRIAKEVERVFETLHVEDR